MSVRKRQRNVKEDEDKKEDEKEEDTHLAPRRFCADNSSGCSTDTKCSTLIVEKVKKVMDQENKKSDIRIQMKDMNER